MGTDDAVRCAADVRGAWQSQQNAPYRYRDYRDRSYFEAVYSAADFACAVERYARDPDDRAKLLMLYWCFPPSQTEHRHLLMRQLAESVAADEPQGDHWLAYALMQMHVLEQSMAARGGPAPRPLAERLAEFRRRYTKGVPAHWADHAVGEEALLAGDGLHWPRCVASLTNLAAHAVDPDWRDYFAQSAATPAADLTPRYTVPTEPAPPSWWPARTPELGNPHLLLAVLARLSAGPRVFHASLRQWITKSGTQGYSRGAAVCNWNET